MPKIGIIDDRDHHRESLARSIILAISDLEKSDEWSVIDSRPFVNMDDYLSWINTNEISILIVDEKLYEDISNGDRVTYKGSDLVEYLRKSYKDLPIYAVSSFSIDEDLQDKFSSFDDIIPRDQYSKNSDQYVERFLRAGKKFLDSNVEKLSELTELSEKIALGNYTEKDIIRANAIQKDLEIPFEAQEVKSRRDWLKKYEAQIKEMNDLQEKIKKFIKKNEHNKK